MIKMKLFILVIGWNYASTMCQVLDDFPLNLNFSQAVKYTYYVDKTLLVKSLFDEAFNRTYMIAPRNFGKTMNLEMLKHFLEIQVDKNGLEVSNKTNTTNFELFTGTRIYKEHPDFFEQHFGRHPVIYMDFKPLAVTKTYEGMYQSLRNILQKASEPYAFLLNIDWIWDGTMKRSIFKSFLNLRRKLPSNHLIVGSGILCQVLHRYFKKLPIILIDEYDSFINAILYENKEEEHKIVEIIELFKFFHIGLGRYNLTPVKKIFCTGVMHISYEDHSVLKDYYFTNAHNFSQYYGLTENELMDVLRNFTSNAQEVEKLKRDITDFYGGYMLHTIGGWMICQETKSYKYQPNKEYILNIHSVFSFLRNLMLGNTNPLQSYWERPSYINSMFTLFYPETIFNELVNLLQNRNTAIAVIDFWSKEDIIDLRRVLNRRKLTAEVDQHHLVMNFLIQHGYFGHYIECGFVKHMQLFRIPNTETKEEIRYLLFKSVCHNFRYNTPCVLKIYKIINSISETNSPDQIFQNLCIYLTKLLTHCRYNIRSEISFERHLYALIDYEFLVYTSLANVEDPTESALEMRFENKNGIAFFIGIKLIRQFREITNEQMKNCTEFAINKLFAENSVLVDDLTQNIVFLGICLGLTNFSGKILKPLGLAYSKSIQNNETLHNKTFIIQDTKKIYDLHYELTRPALYDS